MEYERQLLVLINPFSGRKNGRSIFKNDVLPILQSARFLITVIEFDDRRPLRSEILKLFDSFSAFYGILVIGGDSSVSLAINCIIELTAQDNDETELANLSSFKKELSTPMSIIPTGAINMIASTLYGTNDVVSPLMYLCYGVYISVDLCSVYTNVDKLHSFGFGFSCGYGANICRYLDKYSSLGANKVQSALLRGATKRKQRIIDVEIEYIPYYNANKLDIDDMICTKGCRVCGIDEKNIQSSKLKDQVEIFDETTTAASLSSDNDFNSNSNHQKMKKNLNKWKYLNGKFSHLSIVCNAMLWDMAPGGGVSKYAHLGDGSLDLIMVEDVSRKDFYRFLKRHTNLKNQLDLPFVKHIRCKEVKITILNEKNDLNETNKVYSSTDSDDSQDFAEPEPEPEPEPVHNNLNNSFISHSTTYDHFTARSSSNFDHNHKRRSKRLAKSNNNNNNNQSINDDNESKKEGSVFKMKIIQKSKVISLIQFNSISISFFFNFNLKKSMVNLLKRKNNNSFINPELYALPKYWKEPIFTTYPGKNNFYNKSAFKLPTIWNCDWNLNMITNMHIK
jgi:diacylglycerol kinase family enzyme